jgi:5-methylcytosine-specific restriction endonuclease McrA
MKKPIKKDTIKKYQHKCDKFLQEIGRQVYTRCLVCNADYSCLHHFVHKSQSTALRYDWTNCIPLCAKCHSLIHIGQNELITANIVVFKGSGWLAELEKKKKEGLGGKYGVMWYKSQYDRLKKSWEK